MEQNRRDFMQLLGLGGVVFASNLIGWGCSGSSPQGPSPLAGTTNADAGAATAGAREDFFFLQLSDTHWGYSGPANPDSANTLGDAIRAVNASSVMPDFIMFTGDLTDTTDDIASRTQRFTEFKQMVSTLNVKNLYFIPGEHDAALDKGALYKTFFGDTYYSFDHKGIHFVALDNVSDPLAALGDTQLAWLTADLAKYDPQTPIVVFAHRPLFSLYPTWDWFTADGDKAIAILQQYPNVTVFYGHIHEENLTMTGNIAHHAAKSLIFAFPPPPPPTAPATTPRNAVPWDPAHPYAGIGFRAVEAMATGNDFPTTEYSFAPFGVSAADAGADAAAGATDGR